MSQFRPQVLGRSSTPQVPVLPVVWTVDRPGYAAGRSEPARGRLAMKSSTSCSTHRTARLPTRIGFGNRELGHQGVDGRAGQGGHPRHVSEREKSRGHAYFLPFPARRSAAVLLGFAGHREGRV